MKHVELSGGLFSSSLLARIKSHHYVIQEKASLLLTLICVASIAWIAGQFTWLAYPDTTPAVVMWQPQMAMAQVNNRAAPINLTQLKKSHLFGEHKATQAPVVAKPVIKDAPKTRLNLVLVGAIPSADVTRSLAIIANRGRQNTYGIDEQVEGTRATLKSVLADRVIIENQGRDETLMLQGIQYHKLTQAEMQQGAIAQDPQESPHSMNSADAAKLAKARAEINQDPSKIFRYIGISEVKRHGETIGYRVSPGRDASLFNAAGLKAGDIATSLNGIDLTDPSAMMRLSQEMNNLQALNLTVERAGQQYDINIEL